MYRETRIQAEDRNAFYAALTEQMEALLADETDWIANLANAAGLLFYQLEDVNWVGFYLNRNQELVLGPYQGKPACTRIPFGTGVCGTAAERRESQIVEDVHAFPGHIACDEASRSELVIPMERDGQVLGVLDIDSPVLARFDPQDEKALRTIMRTIIKKSDFSF